MSKVYITKYALTQGIIESENFTEILNDMVRINGKYHQYFHKGEWFSDRKSAENKAEEMRIKKIKTLEKQIEKLKNIKF